MIVVLAASIIGKSGKHLIEGLLAAFSKLDGTGKQHTFVEMESVCYVYQPIEALYLLLVQTSRATFLKIWRHRLLSKLVSAQVRLICFYAFDEALSLGNKENVTVTQVRQYCEMESHDVKSWKSVLISVTSYALGIFMISKSPCTDTESLSSKQKVVHLHLPMLLLKVLV
ncbi:unnamed protein product [Spirodela intermedia]|uniref:Coatomer subunit delta n=1 Tax=Spirodela intermedia TaxID=51605 RepID=A0A7I8JSW2_SPIIN|nr:unnamed protein product [Spirodela intermedia]CAA6672512.1 unnamed protein product [Spirodela intermedia]